MEREQSNTIVRTIDGDANSSCNNYTMRTEHVQPYAAGSRRRVWIAIGVLVALLAMAAAWRWTPLAEQIDIAKITAWAIALRSNPSRIAIMLGAYLIGSIISLPITILILATALVFGPVEGIIYSFIGCMVGAGVTYAMGYFLGRDFIRKLMGARWKTLERKITQTGILAVAALRAIPIAPFTVVNIISGAFQVPIRDYLFGSLLGLAPGIIITNLFAHQLQNAIRNPGLGSLILLALLVIVSILGTIWLRRKLASRD
ncbi:MAG TPA: VTT domain-containing protein [Candidatus Polarisedimenticolaceae bacterium]|nr:VTT domain-containing protein [Candidatus Polarisedimenticolaceae bacterium]